MILILFILIWISCFILYAVSTKQHRQTQQSSYAILAQHPKIAKLSALLILCLCGLLLRSQFVSSISFVALWVFITPVLFIFILRINRLNNRKSQHIS